MIGPERIIFQDIDGPLIPLRMYFGGSRPWDSTRDSFVYDPIAVGMIVTLCQKFNAAVVFNTAHNENPDHIMMHQARYNRLGSVMHPTSPCTDFVRKFHNRYEAIDDWLNRHPEIPPTQWVVIDDMPVHKTRQVTVDYTIGMTLANYQEVCELFGEKQSKIIGVGQTQNANYRT
jgi:hypothetical protein